MKVKIPFNIGKFHRVTWKEYVQFFIEALFYFTCFFPFVQGPVYTGSDTQPYAALMGLVIVGIYWIKEAKTTPRHMALLLICILMGGIAIIGFYEIMVYMVFRSYYTYFSLITITLGGYIIMKRQGGLREPLVKVIIWIWFFTGFMQSYVDPDFAYEILSRHSTNITRGAVGLASEPSAYGFMCLFMMLIAMSFRKRKFVYVALCLIQIVLFANSSVTLVYLAVYVGAYIVNEVLFHKRFSMLKAVGLFGGGLVGLNLIASHAAPSSRMGSLVRLLFDDPLVLLEDGSIVMRLEDIAFCFKSFWENNMLPHGMSSIKYMSGTGLLFYECGFIAFILLVIIGRIIYQAYEKNIALVYVVGFMIIMLSSIPYSSPLVCFYLGFCIYEGYRRKQQSIEQKAKMEAEDTEVIWYAGKMYRRKIM